MTRTRRRAWAVIGALAVAGAAVAAYLTSLHWGEPAALCRGFGDCRAVNTSRYADIGGVPVALLGLALYVTTGALAGAALLRGNRLPEAWLMLAVFGLSSAGMAYSAWLTWVELRVLHAVCPWCLASAALVTGIWVVAAADVLGSRR